MNAQPDFYNTTRLDHASLASAKTAASDQNEMVLAIFRKRGRPLTPWEVWDQGCFWGSQWLIGSVRRSITVLTKRKALVKLKSRRIGPQGALSFEWALAAGQETVATSEREC